jgi:5-methyltetrahydropteroyltriglutamate--homocysteine methyltransferase
MTTNQYRADQVGSLLRSPELLAARTELAEGRLSLEQLRSIEDREILSILARQREAGVDVLTDGELRRGSWLTDMAEAVEGFVPERVTIEWKGPGGGVEGSTAQVAGAPLRKTRKLTGHETPFLARAAGAPFKVTLPAPSNFVLSSFKPGLTDRFYASRSAFLDDVVEIVRDEVQWLIGLGVPYIQFDAPFYSHYLDPRTRGQLQAQGLDPDVELERAIAGDNAAFTDVPRSAVTWAMHVCRGNSRSRWYTEGGYDAIAERLFGALDVDRFLLEYDDERSGGFEVLRFVPKGKTVVLGLVTTKTPALESRDDLVSRIEEASRYLPVENLAISTQCGFASVAAGNRLSVDDQWRKLERVVEAARSVWGPAN